ncbi:hypothetical protein GCM10027405_31950 [Arthrobacter alkaliphilus]|uniref:hypothetical protein n=1 Tax=Arthrobacter alkaliphilus TaxID=369936 RepID=UPI001F33E5A5|nr:hypothetical protein [Arthrobacter alkaliphilus]
MEPIPEGFSSAGPYEIAERHAAGYIDRATMVPELSAWPGVTNEGLAAAQAEWDSTPYADTRGSFEEIDQAYD